MQKDNIFDKDEGDIHDKIDGLLSRTPPELQQVNENLDFIKQVKDNPVQKGEAEIEVFGFETVDISSILKMNIWNRSIFTVDKLSKLFLKMTFEQQKKYLAKKRPLDFNWTWIIIMLMGIVVAVLVMVFLLPRLGNVI